MYYLWKSKQSTPKNLIVYITDYKEISADGKVKIDNHGFLEVELIFQHENKLELYKFSETYDK